MIGEKSYVGLYAGSGGVYAARLDSQWGALKKITPTFFPTAELDLIASIKQALQSQGAGLAGTIVALSGQEVLVRYFEMPLLPKKERTDAVKFEAQKYISFDIMDLYTSFDISIDKRKKTMQVLFLGAKKASIDALTGQLAQQGLQSIILEPISLALLRAASRFTHHKDKGLHAIVGIQANGLGTIVMSRAGSLLLTRDFILTKTGAQNLEYDFQSFLAEIRLFFSYFFKNFQDEEIKNLALFLDPSGYAKDWDKKLQSEIGVPVEIGVAVSLVGEGDQTASTEMSVAIGAALKGISKKNLYGLNLVPQDAFSGVEEEVVVPWETEKVILRKWAIGELVLFGILILGVHLALSGEIAEKNKVLEAKRSERPALASVADATVANEELKKKEGELNQKLNVLSSLMDERVYLTMKLTEVARMIPEEVQLTSLDYRDTDSDKGVHDLYLKLEGNVIAKQKGSELLILNRFVSTLKENREFMKGLGDVKLSSARRLSAGKQEAVMSFSIDAFAAKESRA